VEINAGGRLDQMATQSGRIRLDQRHAHHLAVAATPRSAQVGRVPISIRAPSVAGSRWVDQIYSFGDFLYQSDTVSVFV
jgi:hypothetical protein